MLTLNRLDRRGRTALVEQIAGGKVIRPPAGPHRMTSASPGIVGGRAGLADGHAVSVREGFRVDRPAGFEISPDNLNYSFADRDPPLDRPVDLRRGD
jgi:hypothetical protein